MFHCVVLLQGKSGLFWDEHEMDLLSSSRLRASAMPVHQSALSVHAAGTFSLASSPCSLGKKNIKGIVRLAVVSHATR